MTRKQTVFSKYSYRVVVNYLGNINVFRVLDDGSVAFWEYARSVPHAISLCPGPFTIIDQRTGGV